MVPIAPLSTVALVGVQVSSYKYRQNTRGQEVASVNTESTFTLRVV